MERYTLEIERRDQFGSRANRRVRRDGLIPSIVYSHGEDSIPAKIARHQFELVASRVTTSQIFIFKSPDKGLDGRSAIVKEIQRDYLANSTLHIDFQALKENEEITIRIPLKIMGESPGVKNDGGVLTILTHDVAVTCLPRLIPNEIQVDISALNIGNSIHGAALPLPEGVRLAEDPEETIVSVVAVRVVEEAAPTVEAAATAEAQAAAGAAAATGDEAEKGEKKGADKPEKAEKKG